YETPISAQHEGVTTLQTGTGEQNRYTIGLRGGRHVLLHSSGPGCPACPPTGLHASYDPQGRLSRLNDTELQRDPDGRLRALKPAAAGWPGLVLHYPAQGKRHAWSSALTAQERLDYTARGLLRQRHFANGDSIVYDYDPQGRPIRINSTAGALSELTSLTWKGSVPVSISHPQENETRQYDEHKRLKVRTVRRAAAQIGR